MAIRLAIAQCQPRDNLQSALTYLEQILQQAQQQEVQLLVLPEMFLTGYNIGADAARALALSLDKDELAPLKKLARHYQIALVVGFPERSQDAVFNSAAFIDGQGQVQACYRKTHLYGCVDQEQFSAGARLAPIFTWQGWQCALAICYDIEFPEVARSYALQGAELLLVPTANMLPFELVCYHTIPTRAAENTICLAYANYVGSEGDFTYCGLSCICDPYGQVLARGSSASEALLIADLEQDTLQAARQQLSYLQDRRPDLYQF